MDTPAYSVTVQLWTRPRNGTLITQLTTTHGDPPNPAQRVVLVDPFTWGWEVTDDRIPGTFNPSVLTFRTAAVEAGDLDGLQLGTCIRVLVTIPGTPDLVLEFNGRATDIDLDLDPTRPRPAWATVTCVDWLDDLTQLRPEPNTKTGMGVIGSMNMDIQSIGFGVSWPIAAPTYPSWDDWSGPTTGARYEPAGGTDAWPWPDVNGTEMVARVLNSRTGIDPDGRRRHYALLPSPGTPVGYSPSVPLSSLVIDPVTFDDTGPAYAIVPADRLQSGPIGLPFIPAGNSIAMSPLAVVEQQGVTVVPACAVPAPGRAQRSRASIVTVLSVGGEFQTWSGGVYVSREDYVQTYTAPAVQTHGASAREVETVAVIAGRNLPNDPINGLNSRALALATLADARDQFLSEAPELRETTQYDAFPVRLHALPQAEAVAILRSSWPRVDLANPDRHATTPVVVADLDTSVVRTGRVHGFATQGELSLEGGDLTYSLTIVPGLVETPDATNAHRYTDALGAYTYTSIDQALTYADLALTRRTA